MVFNLKELYKFEAFLIFDLYVRTTTYFRMKYFPYDKLKHIKKIAYKLSTSLTKTVLNISKYISNLDSSSMFIVFF